MRSIYVLITIISILALTSMAYADDYYRGKGYSVYAGFYGPPAFKVIIGDGKGSIAFYGNGYGSYYYYDDNRYYGKHRRYNYMRHRPYRYGYGHRNKFYGRGFNRFPRRGYWR